MALQQTIRRFGVPSGAPGIQVIEKAGGNALTDPRYGTTAMFGILKRGPMGVAIPVSSKRQYDEIFGDPRDSRWHLYADGSHLLPDAIDGYYGTGGGAGTLWLTRLDLDGKARRAEVTLRGRAGGEAMKVMAANEGRWGGYANSVKRTPVIAATMVTFTLYAPGLLVDEMVDAVVSFTGAPGKTYKIVSNTAADPVSGEAVFVVGAQYNLLGDGVSGPTALAGTVTYTSRVPISGTVEFVAKEDATGTVQINDRVITGTGTAFSTEYRVGANVYYLDEARVVTSITSNTTMTISAAFTSNATGATIQYDSRVLTGTTTDFAGDLAPGNKVYLLVNGEVEERVVASIESATSLTLESGFTDSVSAGSQIQKDNLTVTGVGTSFTTALTVGDYLVDPNRAGEAIKVTAVTSATALTIERPFSSDFTGAQLTKQGQTAQVILEQPVGTGLSVEITQGSRFPATHFGMTVRFNGSVVASVDDASLDPQDSYFVESLINDSNVAYRTGSSNYQKWVTVESLWNSAYTTNEDYDVRPANGAGEVLEILPTKLYTVADMNYAAAIGNLLYPNPYDVPRGFIRVKDAAAPLTLQGTVSSLGVNVTGTGTAFRTELKVGDYLYDPATNTVRKIRSVTSNTALVLESAFSTNMAALTEARRAGWFQGEQSYNLQQMAAVGDRFTVTYPQYLEKGYDGDASTPIPYYFTKYADVDFNHLENASFGRNMGLIRMACPGISDTTIQKAFINYASTKAYEFRAEIPSLFNSAAAAESFVLQSLGRNDFMSISFPSYGFIANPNGFGDRLISLSGEIMGGESLRSTENEGYHVPFAGVRAILPRIIKLPFEAYPNDEAILNVAGIQTIKNMFGNVVVYGARVPSLSPTYDFLHIRRIQSNFVRVFLEARTLLEMLFQPNQPQLSEQIVMIMNNFARREYKKGVFSTYLSFKQAVQAGSTLSGKGSVVNQSDADGIVSVINGQLTVYFRYVPTGVLEKLSIEAGPDILVAQYGNTVNSGNSVG